MTTVMEAAADLAPHVRPMMAQHRTTIAMLRTQLEVLPDVAAELEEQTTESERVSKLDQVARDMIDMLMEAETRLQILEDLGTSMSSHQNTSLADIYCERVQAKMDGYQAQTARQRYARHPAYIEFRSRVWEVSHQGAMPPLVDLLPREPGDDNVAATPTGDDEEDIVVGGTVLQLRCPLTAHLLQDPVVNTTCQHAYSREAISVYLSDNRTRSGSVQCPATGCTASVTRSTLQDAPALKRRVERYERHQLHLEEQRRTQDGITRARRNSRAAYIAAVDSLIIRHGW